MPPDPWDAKLEDPGLELLGGQLCHHAESACLRMKQQRRKAELQGGEVSDDSGPLDPGMTKGNYTPDHLFHALIHFLSGLSHFELSLRNLQPKDSRLVYPLGPGHCVGCWHGASRLE